MNRVTSRDAFYYTVEESLLQAYEDLEEDGFLVRIPCHIGDTFYVVNQEDQIFEAKKCFEIKINQYGQLMLISDEGKSYDPKEKNIVIDFEGLADTMKEEGGFNESGISIGQDAEDLC